MSSAFTVHKTFGATQVSNGRADLDMVLQRYTARRDARLSHHQQRLKEYRSTCGTLQNHRIFLVSLIGEAARYQTKQMGPFGGKRTLLVGLLAEIDEAMQESDQYLILIEKIAGSYVFHRDTTCAKLTSPTDAASTPRWASIHHGRTFAMRQRSSAIGWQSARE